VDFALRSNAVVIYIFPGCTSDILRRPEGRGLGIAAVIATSFYILLHSSVVGHLMYFILFGREPESV